MEQRLYTLSVTYAQGSIILPQKVLQQVSIQHLYTTVLVKQYSIFAENSLGESLSVISINFLHYNPIL